MVDHVRGARVFLPQATGPPSAKPLRDMITAVARAMGGSASTQLRALAKEYIIKSLRQINIAEDFVFARTATASAPLVEDQRKLAIPPEAFVIGEVQLVYTAAGAPRPEAEGEAAGRLDWTPWEHAQRLYPLTAKGRPERWWAENNYLDRQIDIYPACGEAAARDYATRMVYHTRLTTPTSEGDVLLAPPEFVEVVEEWAKGILLEEQDTRNEQRWMLKKAEARELLAQYKGNVDLTEGQHGRGFNVTLRRRR